MSKLADRRRQLAAEADVPKGLQPARVVSHITGVPPSTLRRWARDGRVRAQKFGSKLWYVDLEDAQRVAETIKPGPQPSREDEA